MIDPKEGQSLPKQSGVSQQLIDRCRERSVLRAPAWGDACHSEMALKPLVLHSFLQRCAVGGPLKGNVMLAERNVGRGCRGVGVIFLTLTHVTLTASGPVPGRQNWINKVARSPQRDIAANEMCSDHGVGHIPTPCVGFRRPVSVPIRIASSDGEGLRESLAGTDRPSP